MAEIAIVTILKALKSDLSKLQHRKIAKIYQNQNSDPLKGSKWQLQAISPKNDFM